MNFKNKKIAVAISGGVDSSVAAFLLKQSGAEVVGVTGKMIDNEISDMAVKQAQKVCNFLDIKHIVVDLTEKFNKEVIEYFNNSYKNGQTPNPCVVCNKKIKWKALFEDIKADFYATGHYADLKNENGKFKLSRAKDEQKDQLYMLFELSQNDLSKTIFPLAKYTKEQVRNFAQEANLPCANSKDSQDICFIAPPDTAKKYILRTIGEKTGNIIDLNTKKILGQHTGAHLYTVGQRKGIGIAAEKPLYVISTDTVTNTVFVGFKEHLLKNELFINQINWQLTEYKNDEFEAKVKIRYNTTAKDVTVIPLEDNKAKIVFKEPQHSVSPGQAAVIYNENNEFLIGGGWIEG